MSWAELKTRDLGSDRGYRVAVVMVSIRLEFESRSLKKTEERDA